MAIFNESEFYSIVRESIRLGIVVPFDCYLRLSKNNRIIKFLHKDNFPIESTFEKLKEFEVTDIYIKTEDLEAYKNYIRQFLETDEGKKFAESFDSNSTEIKGIPQDMLNDLQKVKGGISDIPASEFFQVGSILGSNSDFTPEDSNKIKIATQKINFQLGEVFDPKNTIGKVKWDMGGGKVTVHGRYDVNEELVKISSKFSNDVVKFALGPDGSQVIQKEDIFRIQGAMVNFLNNEIHRINSGGGGSDDDLRGRFNVMISNTLNDVEKKSGIKINDNFRVNIGKIEQNINKELFLVKDYAPETTDPSKDLFIIRDHRKKENATNHQHFKMPDYAEENLQEQIGVLSMIAASGDTPAHKKLKDQVKNFKENLLQAKAIGENDLNEVEFAVDKTLLTQRATLEKKAVEENVSPNLLNFFEGIKKIYDADDAAKAFIDDQGFTSFESPAEITQFLTKIKFFFGNIPTDNSSEEVEKLRSELAKEKEKSKVAELAGDNAREKLLNEIIEKQKKAITIYQNRIKGYEEIEKASDLTNEANEISSLNNLEEKISGEPTDPQEKTISAPIGPEDVNAFQDLLSPSTESSQITNTDSILSAQENVLNFNQGEIPSQVNSTGIETISLEDASQKEATIVAQEQVIKAAETEIVRKEGEINELEKTAEKEIKNLASEVSDAKLSLEKIQSENTELTGKNKTLEEEKTKLIQERDELQLKVTNFEKDIESINRENKQLKESSSTMESKLQEFEEFVNSHVTYIDSIEKENQAFQTAMTDLKKSVDDEHFKNEKLEDLKRDNETVLNRNDEEIKGYQNTITDLRTTVGEKEREIDKLSTTIEKLEKGSEEEVQRAKDSLGNVIKEKEKQISKLQTQVDNNKDIIRSLNKDIGMLKNHNDDVLRLKKKLGDQLAEIDVQKSVFKKKEEALNSKVIMLTNLNQQTRKTITRLTIITEQLRKDKLKLATDKANNDAVKDQLSKTILTLKSSARAIQQREAAANKTIEKLNTKVSELQKQFAEETKKTFDLEKKVRAYKLKAS